MMAGMETGDPQRKRSFDTTGLEVVPEMLKPLLVIRHQTLEDSVTAATPDLAR
jgi:hypothetical protein